MVAGDEFLAKFIAGAAGDESSSVYNDDAVAGALDFGEYVAGEDDGHAASQAIDESADALYLVGVESDGGFVHNDDFWLAEECVCDTDALAEAFGEGADDFTAGGACEVAGLHYGFDGFADFFVGDGF